MVKNEDDEKTFVREEVNNELSVKIAMTMLTRNDLHFEACITI